MLSELPRVPGVTIGYRVWNIAEVDRVPRLLSVTSDQVWKPRHALVAKCPKTDHEPAQLHCTCGIHGARTPDILSGHYAYHLTQEDVCMGSVALWGRIAQSSLLYRGQYAYPRKLWLNYLLADRYARPLEAIYGVRVFITNIYRRKEA
jgi:hypothetical protein